MVKVSLWKMVCAAGIAVASMYSTDVSAQVDAFVPSVEACDALVRQRIRGEQQFTIYEAYVIGRVEQWLDDHKFSLEPHDGWTVLEWIDDACEADPTLTVSGAVEKVIYEKLVWPNSNRLD